MQYPIFKGIKPIKSATICNYPCKYSFIELCILSIIAITYSIDSKVWCMLHLWGSAYTAPIVVVNGEKHPIIDWKLYNTS